MFMHNLIYGNMFKCMSIFSIIIYKDLYHLVFKYLDINIGV